MSTRGEHLVRADRGFATGGGMLAWLTAPAFSKVLDEIHRRLACGGIVATLPDGSTRRLGFHVDGPKADIRLSSWLALVRLATGSATVAMTMASAIVAPVAAHTPVRPELLTIATGAGSLIFSHFNDGGFWLVKEYFGMSVPQTLKSWSVSETIISVVGLVLALALAAVI